MTATAIMQENGRQRKSLAEQIDRLDQILDGLSEALNESVAEAVRNAVAMAVEQAVTAVLTEVLTNPEVLRKVAATVAVPVAAQPMVSTPKLRLLDRAVRLCRWAGAGVRSAGSACVGAFHVARHGLGAAWAKMQVVRQFKYPLLLALAAGVLASVAVYHAGPHIAAVAGWVAGFTTSLSVQAGLWLRRVWANVGPFQGA